MRTRIITVELIGVTGIDYWTGLAPWGCGILGDGVSLADC